MVEVGEDGLVITAVEPAGLVSMVHCPTPRTGVLPVKVVLVNPHKS